MMMTPPHIHDNAYDSPNDCAAYDRLVNVVLDGEAAVSELFANTHPTGCQPCREIRDAAILLINGLKQTPSAKPQPDFVDKVTRSAARDYQKRRIIRWSGRVASGAIAAGILIIWLSSPSALQPTQNDVAGSVSKKLPEPLPVLNPEMIVRDKSPADSLQERLGEAGSALIALSRKATDETLTPARNLLPAPTPRVLPMQTSVELPEPLTELPQAAKAGLEPLTNTAKRAVNLFLRDVGGAAGAVKMGS
jgi:hypothetical protein